MNPTDNWPFEVLSRAHTKYQAAICDAGLFGTAFFGHSQPEEQVKTPESIWRGLCRAELANYASTR